jgi:hypothetical protein
MAIANIEKERQRFECIRKILLSDSKISTVMMEWSVVVRQEGFCARPLV